jgi:acyl carrier protein
VIAALQIRFPTQPIQTTTKLDDDLGMDSDAAATLLPGMMMGAVEGYGCHSRLGSDDYSSMGTVQDIIDAIWDDLQDR